MAGAGAEVARVAGAGGAGGAVAAPAAGARVRNAECALSFAGPRSPGGLLVGLRDLRALGPAEAAARGRAGLFVRIQETAVPAEDGAGAAEAGSGAAGEEEAPQELALGTAGGFSGGAADDRQWVRELSVVARGPAGEEAEAALGAAGLPEGSSEAAEAVASAQDWGTREAVAAAEAAWRPDGPRESRYARGLQQDPGAAARPVQRSNWRCASCGAAENLWLNLSDGFIGCGRRHFDGSGGCGAALEHFESSGRQCPLAVKLGTITPKGADVYSYAPVEDDMVLDPLLAEHLRHWGINVLEMEKTDKTMEELQIDLNLRHEFDVLTEAGAELEPLSGPGYVGLRNLGNTCYLNSTMQALCLVPHFVDQFEARADALLASAPDDAEEDLVTQTAKLARALVSCEGMPDFPGTPSVAPRMFKTVIGRGHPEFSTGRQQDAVEFFQHLLEQLQRRERADAGRLGGARSTAAAFAFDFEDRIQCAQSEGVAYSSRQDNVLALRLPFEEADLQKYKDADDEREAKRKKLREQGGAAPSGGAEAAGEGEGHPELACTLEQCLEKLAAAETVQNFLSPATGQRGDASKTARFKTFPPFLMVYLQRYYIDSSWTPKKIEARVAVPDILDLEHLRAKGLQPGEKELGDEPAAAGAGAEPAAAEPQPEANAAIVEQLVAMGFSENGAKRAALATGNADVQVAMEWVMNHMGDPDFNDPPPAGPAEPAAGAGGGAPGFQADPASVEMLGAMGFSAEHAAIALEQCSGSLERAADWLFSHPDPVTAAAEAAGAAAAAGGPPPAVAAPVEDGPGRYELAGFISHIGSNTACGHYVAHLRKAGRWVIFNDEKVAASKQPPRELGYMYLYRRAPAL